MHFPQSNVKGKLNHSNFVLCVLDCFCRLELVLFAGLRREKSKLVNKSLNKSKKVKISSEDSKNLSQN
jgi:hypothetical protein